MTAARYDIVGCGAVVQHYHLPALKLLQQRQELQVNGCYDLDDALARRVAAILGADHSGSQPSPQAGDGVDAALVTTPPSAHAEIASQYVRCGKSVFVEKPFTTTASEAGALLGESRERGARVAVDHFRRFYPSVNIARELLRGRLGEVHSIEMSEGHRWEWASMSNYALDDPYGGVIHNVAAHPIDTALYVLGLDEEEDAASIEIDEVAKLPSAEPSHECRAKTVLRTKEGQRIGMEVLVSRLRPLARGLKIRGSFGLVFVPAMIARSPLLFRESGGFRVNGAESTSEATDPEGCFLLAHRAFLAALRDPHVRTRIDGDRFLLLSQILESLHERPGQ
jgi:predicted dehydrogenase